tara:strand:- start:8264 stop:9094 length:831 start_codon:yes stop_codon:yes gene_type:complete
MLLKKQSLSFVKHSMPKSLRMPIRCITNPLPGIDIGIPLTIFQNAYTKLHYGESIVDAKDIALQFLLGYYVYGTDRYEDALEYEESPYSTPKKDLYDYIIANKVVLNQILLLTYTFSIYLLLNNENFLINLPFVGLLQATQNYKEIKYIIGPWKPVFISIMWTACAVWLPCVLHDHDYSILMHPEDYLPCTLTLFSASNIVDNKDIHDDTLSGINTIPVLYGEEKSNMISMLGLIISSILLGVNHNYLAHPLLNSYMELQNGAISFLPFVLNATLH